MTDSYMSLKSVKTTLILHYGHERELKRLIAA